MKNKILTPDYIKAILSPFVGKEIRMRYNEYIPFALETSIESTFQINLTNIGIAFILKDNYYIKKDFKTFLNQAIVESGLYPHTIDNLFADKDGKVKDNVFQDSINKFFETHFHPQIAFTYFTYINDLRVNERGFFLNGAEFVISS